MNIPSISSGSTTSLATLRSNNEIKALESQKEQLQNQIKKTRESDLSSEIKQDMIKLLQDQIQQVETEIQQKRTEKVNQTINKDTEKTSRNIQNDRSNGENNNVKGMTDLLQASSSYAKAKVISSTKNELNGKSSVLKIEIKLNEGRGDDVTAKKTALNETELRVETLNEKLGQTLQTSQGQAKEVSKADGNDTSKKDASEAEGAQDNNVKDMSNQDARTSKPAEAQGAQIFESTNSHKAIDIRV